MRQESFDDRPKQPAATRDEATQGATIFHSEAAFDLVRRHLACGPREHPNSAAAVFVATKAAPDAAPRARPAPPQVVCAGTMSYFRDAHATVGRMLAQAESPPPPPPHEPPPPPRLTNTPTPPLSLRQTKSGGRLLIVQPSSGVPELQAELMKMARGNDAHHCTAEQVKHLLSQFKLPPFSMSYVAATLSCTECLLRNPIGLQVTAAISPRSHLARCWLPLCLSCSTPAPPCQIISHCLECDVRRLCEHKMMRILKARRRDALAPLPLRPTPLCPRLRRPTPHRSTHTPVLAVDGCLPPRACLAAGLLARRDDRRRRQRLHRREPRRLPRRQQACSAARQEMIVCQPGVALSVRGQSQSLGPARQQRCSACDRRETR